MQNQATLILHSAFLFISDHEGIQTPDRWSRNPVLYSAELRGPLHYINFDLTIVDIV